MSGSKEKRSVAKAQFLVFQETQHFLYVSLFFFFFCFGAPFHRKKTGETELM